MRTLWGLSVAFAICLFALPTFAQQCSRSGGSQPRGAMSSGGSGSFTSQPSGSLYSNSGGMSYVPNASQMSSYNNQAMYQALQAQRMDRYMQMQMANQVAAQRAALRNAQKAKKEAKKQEMYTASER